METVLPEALAIATGGLFSIGSILITLVLLSTEGGLRKAAAYYTGYCGSYMVIGGITVVIGARLQSSSPGTGESLPIGSWLSVVLGMLLLLLCARKWRSPRDAPSSMPKLLGKLDKTSAARMLGFGAMVSVVNFKNLAIYLSAISILVEGQLVLHEAAISVVLVALVFCFAVLCPIVLYMIGSKRAGPWLKSLRRMLEEHNRPLSIAAMLVFGSIFVTKGVLGLLSS